MPRSNSPRRRKRSARRWAVQLGFGDVDDQPETGRCPEMSRYNASRRHVRPARRWASPARPRRWYRPARHRNRPYNLVSTVAAHTCMIDLGSRQAQCRRGSPRRGRRPARRTPGPARAAAEIALLVDDVERPRGAPQVFREGLDPRHGDHALLAPCRGMTSPKRSGCSPPNSSMAADRPPPGS